MYKILLIYLLLDVCTSSSRNFRISHGGGDEGGYAHHSDMTVQHDNNYQHYDSYSSEEVVMRASPRRKKKFHRHFDYSDSQYDYKCQCSCTKCKKRKPKPKPCCEEFCATECAPQNNILVVPYPVPFMVFNQSVTDFPLPPIPTISTKPPMMPSSSSTTTTTYEPPTTTTTQTTPTTRRTVAVTYSTLPYYDTKPYKRFRIINENNPRRNNMAKNVLHSSNFGRLPKYGIVPIPENLALSLMQQIRKDQNNDQLRKRLALDRNLLDYTRKPIA